MPPRPPHLLNEKSVLARLAGLAWSADSLGAALFAASLAAWLGGDVAHVRSPAAPWLLALIAASGAIRAAVQGLAVTAGQRAANRAKQALRVRLFAALLPTGYQRRRLPGEDLRNAIDDVEVIDGYVGRFVPARLAAIVSPLVCALLAALASPVAAAIMAATLAPFALGMVLAGSAARHEADRQFAALSRLTGLFVDRARMLPIILAFGAESRVTRQIAQAAREVAERTIRTLQIAFVSSAVLEFFSALAIALVAVYCGFSLLGLLPFRVPEQLDLARAFFVLALAPEFYLGMRRLAAAYHDKQQGEAAARAIAPQLALAEGLLAAGAAYSGAGLALAVESLVIRYDDGGTVGPITARWPDRGLHVITGATGAGKSSLLHALVAMAPVAGGAIRLGGTVVPPGAFNDRVGWSGQRPLLLPGTLADNVLLGADDGAADMFPMLARRLGLGRLLVERGAGLMIDPGGSGLSGGERRRIGLARALLSGRPILLLDEPTADLDPANARLVIDAVLAAAETRLIIAATHDPALAARAMSEVGLR